MESVFGILNQVLLMIILFDVCDILHWYKLGVSFGVREKTNPQESSLESNSGPSNYWLDALVAEPWDAQQRSGASLLITAR